METEKLVPPNLEQIVEFLKTHHPKMHIAFTKGDRPESGHREIIIEAADQSRGRVIPNDELASMMIRLKNGDETGLIELMKEVEKIRSPESA